MIFQAWENTYIRGGPRQEADSNTVSRIIHLFFFFVIMARCFTIIYTYLVSGIAHFIFIVAHYPLAIHTYVIMIHHTQT